MSPPEPVSTAIARTFLDSIQSLMSITQDLDAAPNMDSPRAVAAPPAGLDDFETVIRPGKGWIAINWRELAQSRELFDTLVMRDIKIRYKQTVLGVAWAVIQPLLQMVVFTLLFSRAPELKPAGIPHALFLFAGLVPWTFFTNAVAGAGLSLINQQQLLTKIYFPRIFVPASTAGAFLVDLFIGLLLFAILLPIYGFAPSWAILTLPILVVLSFVAALGLGLTLAAATILFRDLRFVIPFVLQTLMFLSPVFYPLTILTRPQQLIASLNPMTGIITAYRWAILGMPLDPLILAISTATSLALLVFGLFFFRRTERLFADLA